MPTLKSMQIWPENFQDANDFWSTSENGKDGEMIFVFFSLKP